MDFKLALVTGASAGLGKALCQRLAERKISLILIARDEKRLKELASSLPVQTEICCADLSLANDREKLIQLIHDKKPDLVINNAGFGRYGPVLAHPLSANDEMIEVNIRALTDLSIESARALKKADKRGTVVNVSSAAAFFSYPTFCIYAATKAYVNRFSEALDLELKPHGIRVLTVCPGQISTSFRLRASGNFPQKEDKISMTAEHAAELIIRQIQRGKSLAIIDWRTRILVTISRLLPAKLLQSLLMRSLKKRHVFSD